MSPKNKLLLGFIVIPFVIVLDFLSKIYAQNFLFVICNKGISFGLGNVGISFLISGSLLTLLSFLLVKENNKVFVISYLMILSAGSANFLDRLLNGCVRDFINIGAFLPYLKFLPLFNLADLTLTAGFVIMLWKIVIKLPNIKS